MLHLAVALALAHGAQAQVELLNVLVVQELLRVAVQDDAPVLHDVAVAGDLEGHHGVLLHQEDGHPLLAVQAHHDVEDLGHQLRGQPQGGLVQQHQLGPAHEGAADGQHLLLAAGEVARLDVAAGLQLGEVVVDHLQVAADLAVATDVGTGNQVLLGGQVLEDAPPLHHLHDAQAHDLGRVAVLYALALELDAALGDLAPLGAQEPRDGLEGGALAGAVGPQEGDDAPLGDLQRHPPQHQHHAVVDDLDVVDLQQGSLRRRYHRSAPPSGRRRTR